VLEEIYVSISDLQRPLMPNVNLAGNRWLFQHLTQTLDLGVLALLARRPEQMMPGPISINMNIDTLLSKSFLKFDGVLREGQQTQIIIELQPVDVFADIKAFQFGRDFVRGKGYRLCLDGLSPESLVLCDRGRLGVDFLKLHWSDSMPDASGENGVPGFVEAVRRAGPERLIIARCDNGEAIDYGRSLGLKLFQGRHLDQILNPGQIPRN
jgi:EAL domain-containing protein (putative c-di-GMP-specific phosphodiesterase class I)